MPLARATVGKSTSVRVEEKVSQQPVEIVSTYYNRAEVKKNLAKKRELQEQQNRRPEKPTICIDSTISDGVILKRSEAPAKKVAPVKSIVYKNEEDEILAGIEV